MKKEHLKSNSFDIERYIEINTNGNSLYNGETTSIPVDDLSSNEVNIFLKNNFEGYDVYLKKSNTGNHIIIESNTDSPIWKITTVKEASTILGITERGVRDNCSKGKYICRQSGSTWIIDKSSLIK